MNAAWLNIGQQRAKVRRLLLGMRYLTRQTVHETGFTIRRIASFE
jgi:hypothetical protein